MHLFLRPVDALLLRDDRPFGRRGHQTSQSLFPPRPSVFAGALRSWFMAAWGTDFEAYRRAATGRGPESAVPPPVREVVGFPGRPGRFRLCAATLARRTGRGIEPLEAVPADLFADEERGALALARPQAELPGTHPHRGLALPWCGFLAAPKRARGYLAPEDYARYLGGTPPLQCRSETEFLTREVRAGVGLDPGSRTAAEGLLFSSECILLAEDCGFLLEVEGLEPFPGPGLLRLGGDGRMAWVEPVSPPALTLPGLAEEIARSGRFRLIFRAPARFRQGWLPGTARCEGGEILWEWEEFTLRLIAAALEEAAPVAGWDLVRNAPKPLQAAVPAGAVYWLEVLAGDPSLVQAKLHGAALDEVAPHEGFGIVHVGAW